MTVTIVGAGPVGLFLGCLLAQQGIAVEILERRTARSPHSRAIGLHPPALALLERVGVLDALLERVVRVTGGCVFYEQHRLGRLSLSSIGGRFPFSVSIPQGELECLLEQKLVSLPNITLHRGVTVTSLDSLKTDFVVGSDGKDSFVRTAAQISCDGAPYPDHFLMGDFTDDTEFGSDAALFLTRQGIVESFPLPNQKRRWVARTFHDKNQTTAAQLSELVAARTGRTLPIETCFWMSAFRVQHQIARRFVSNNLALVGDAAHVISPIGGQGITLGFLGAAALAAAILRNNLSAYEESQRKLALRVGQRAAFNTAMGRPCGFYSARLLLVRALLTLPPLTRRFARQFTMDDLVLYEYGGI